MKYTPVFFDTETTGNQSTDRICQMCYLYHHDNEKVLFAELFKPSVPISIESMAIHHITNKHIANRPEFQSAPEYPTIKTLFENPRYVPVAHNAPFDVRMLAHEGIYPPHYIDTLRIVRHLDPDMEMKRQNLQYLRYYIEGINDALPETVHAHDALGDVLVLEQLFNHLSKRLAELEQITDPDIIIERMIAISQTPSFIGKFTFGKHTGKLVREVAQTDPDYLSWLLNQKRNSEDPSTEADWIYTLETVLREL